MWIIVRIKKRAQKSLQWTRYNKQFLEKTHWLRRRNTSWSEEIFSFIRPPSQSPFDLHCAWLIANVLRRRYQYVWVLFLSLFSFSFLCACIFVLFFLFSFLSFLWYFSLHFPFLFHFLVFIILFFLFCSSHFFSNLRCNRLTPLKCPYPVHQHSMKTYITTPHTMTASNIRHYPYNTITN